MRSNPSESSGSGPSAAWLAGPGASADPASTPHARLDLDRRRRIGMVEAIWGETKSAEQIAAILVQLGGAGELGLVTRVDPAKAEAVARLLGDGGPGLEHHPLARCLTWGELPAADPALGLVAVLCGGTSDLGVALEAELALRAHGAATRLLADVGVAGLHRLLGVLESLTPARVLIACAGMEGALPTVLAGLAPQPVIGVPVSVGYGVGAGGHAALHGMLASCAPGLAVVNIDNGYGAAMAALRILQSRPPA